MPTGITAPIEEDPEFTWEELVWRCARMFLWDTRDKGITAPIPESYEVQDAERYMADIKRARQEIAKWEAVSDQDAFKKAQEEYAEQRKSWEESEQHRKAILAKYEPFFEKTRAWNPQDESIETGVKRFVLEQLEESTKYEHNPSPKPEGPITTLTEAAAWRQKRLDWAKEDLTRAEERLQKAQVGCDNINAWLKALRATVPQPNSMKKA
jgi:hypothetical protein